MSPQRRALLGAGLAGLLGSACRPTAEAPTRWPGGWVGATPERGHRLRAPRSGALPAAATQGRADVLVLGAGIAGLAAARALVNGGITDVHLLELEDQPGGNSRGHRLAGLDCPLGAHYLPLPGPQAREVDAWLQEIGLLRQHLGQRVADERHLCHSPQERLFIDGAWHDGLLPPAEGGSATQAQYRRFSAEVARAQRELGFALPSARAPWTAGHAALDALPFARWLDECGLNDERLRWFLDYACRDDYGADAATVSAWAGLHYFASRHGFAVPGDEAAERDAVFTWPEGNAWLVQRLAQPLAERVHTGRTVLRVDEGRHGVDLLCHDESSGQPQAWRARAVVLALPLLVAQRLLSTAPAALASAAAQQSHAPWLVANLHLDGPLQDRPEGAPLSWDNVRYGSPWLGYVNAGHQALNPVPGPGVLTAYLALPVAERARLLQPDPQPWMRAVVDELKHVHPDIAHKVRRIDLARWGHAMSIPRPGLRSSPALQALARQPGRIRFAHADLAGYSVFEEAFTLGSTVGADLARALRTGTMP
ncbi:protoporphyrinogen oxidase [Burkholderiales bacterium JOSHI_001]|nr:protoporphyrinogen oxidase [Burkholderiales bacterium JOSHI_001]